MQPFLYPLKSQPQSGAQIDWSSPLFAGGSEIAILGPGLRDLAKGTPLVSNGTNTLAPTLSGLGYANAGAGDIGIPVSAYGGSVSVTFWAGYYYGSVLSNKYLFGDYTGSVGSGLTPRHSNIGNRWGYFTGNVVVDGGETLVDGKFYVFVVVREAAGGALKVYRDGVLKIASAGSSSYQSTFCAGSIGSNQSTLRTNCTTLLAGRIRYKSWTAAQVRLFSQNIWQIFKSEERLIWVPDAAGAGVSSVYSDIATAFNVRGAAQIDLATSYNLRNSASQDISPAFSVRVAAPADLSLAYTLRGAASQDITSAFSVRGAVPIDLSPVFNVRGLIQIDESASYSIRGAVSADITPGYSIMNAGVVASDLITSYQVRGIVQRDMAATYSMRGSAQGDLPHSYVIRGAVATDMSPSYVVAGNVAAVQSDLDVNYSVFGVTATCPTAADIAAAVRADLSAELARIDVAISSRATVAAIMGATAP